MSQWVSQAAYVEICAGPQVPSTTLCTMVDWLIVWVGPGYSNPWGTGLFTAQPPSREGEKKLSFHRKPELLLTYIQWWHSHPHKPSAPKMWPAQSTWFWPKQELNQSWVWLKRQHNSLNPDRFTAYLSAHNANESSLPKRSSVISQQSAIIKLKPGS